MLKHFSIDIQAFLQGGMEKHFLVIWEKLDEIEHQLREKHNKRRKKQGNENNQGQGKPIPK